MTPAQLKKELLKFDVPTLADIIIGAISRNTPFKNAILEQVVEKTGSTVTQTSGNSTNTDLADNLLWGHWKEMKKIVAKSNKEGYEDASARNKFAKLYEKIEDILSKATSRIERMKVLDEMIEQRKLNNSGFISELDDLLFLLCDDRRDWAYLVKQYTELQKKSKGYDKDEYTKLIFTIQKDKLADEETYIALAKQNLSTPDSYLELGKFYIEKKKDEAEGLKILKQGIKTDVYVMSELVSYFYEYCLKNKLEKEIEDLTKLELKDIYAQQFLTNSLFAYYKPKNYEIARKVFMKYFSGKFHVTYELYEKALDFLKPNDFAAEKPKIMELLKSRNPIDYLKVLIKDNQYQDAFNSLEKVSFINYGSYELNKEWFFIFTKIGEKMPKEMVGYLLKLARKLINLSERSNYTKAAQLLKLAISLAEKDVEIAKSLQTQISFLMTENARKPALLEELTKVGFKKM